MKLQQIIYTLFKVAFRIVETIAPPIAGRWAVRLFFRPMRYPRPRRELPWLESAQIQKVPFEGYYRRPPADSYYTTYQWGEGPTVLLVHGWAGRGTQMGAFAPSLVEAGYRVVTFDAPAHGDSPGNETNLLEFVQIIKEIERASGGLVALIGHSFGGVASALAMQQGVEAEKLVSLGAPAEMDFVLNNFAEQINATDRSIRTLRAHLSQLAAQDIDDFSLSRIATDLTVPGLIFHDRQDRSVAYHQGQLFSQSWPQARMITTDGLGHNRTLTDSKVIAMVTEFIAGSVTETAPAATEDLAIAASDRLG